MPFFVTDSTNTITSPGTGDVWMFNQSVTTNATTTATNFVTGNDTSVTGTAANIFQATNVLQVTNTSLTISGTAATDATNNITIVGGDLNVHGTIQFAGTNDSDITIWDGWNNRIPAEMLRRMDPVERARHEEREREWEERRQREAAERVVAEGKAERLLLSTLTDRQRDEYERLKRFHVHTPDGRIYRILKGWAGNVKLVPTEEAERGEILESLCIHPTRRIPDCDNMLAQKLMIEHSEPDFRRIANISRGHW